MSPFIVDGFPRTGSTTLAKLLDLHPDIACLIEPFHPRRYGGHFYRMSVESGSVQQALSLINHRWNGLKHVWEAESGWPFPGKSSLNDELVLSSGKVLYLRRRNYLKRYISGYICAHVNFWIGTKQEFLARLERTGIPELNVDTVRAALNIDRAAVAARLELLAANGVAHKSVFYEDLFRPSVSEDEQLHHIRQIFAFLDVAPLDMDAMLPEVLRLLNPYHFRWAEEDVYLRIPHIEALNQQVASSELGSLFD